MQSRKRYKALFPAVETAKQVVSITHSLRAVEVSCADGSRISAQACLLAVPPAALTSIAFTPVLSPRLNVTLSNVKHSRTLNVFFACSEKYWEQDGLPAVALSDHGFSAMFPVYDRNTRQRPFEGPDITAVAVTFVGSHLPPPGLQGDALTPWALRRVAEVRPGIASYFGPLEIWDWRGDADTSGALPYRGVGCDLAGDWDTLHSRHGRLFFAGDYTEGQYVGVDAAVFSGLRAADNILESESVGFPILQ